MNSFSAKQAGFSLVTTLFILVVLAVLGVYMSLMVGVQNQSTALTVQGFRAWYAAISGLDWTAYQINTTGNCPAVPTTMTIEGFTVSLTDCTSYPVFEAGNNYNLHDVTLLSERGSFGELDYVSRSVRATIGGP